MAEYIDRAAAMTTPVLPKEYRQYQTDNLDDAYEQGWMDALDNLKNAPAADAAPVRHGRWKYNTDFQVWNCSECGENPHKGTGVVVVEENLPAYCPHCGARMDGVE